jgi:LCP family protein required for cell wall assembly
LFVASPLYINVCYNKKVDDRFDQINRALGKELQEQKRKAKWAWVWLFSFLCLAAAFILAPNFLLKNNQPAAEESKFVKSVQATKERIKAAMELPESIFAYFSYEEPKNILLLGVPGQGNDAPDLTDTILIAQIKKDPLRINLISIPRDLWVRVPDSETYTKINTLYVFGKSGRGSDFGISLVQQKIEEITGLKIDHHFLIDMSLVKQIIDELGGVNVWVAKDISDSQFPGPNHSYETFEIKAGWRYLDGETASKYMRTRHSSQGDFDRIQRQQQVLEALKQKLMGLNPISDLPPILKIAEKFWSNIKTDISLTDLPGLWQIAKQISPEEINNIVIDREENHLVIGDNLLIGEQIASILKPRAGIENYSEIQAFIQNNQ